MFSMLELSEKLMSELWYFWYDYVNQDTDCLIMNSIDDWLNEKIVRLIKDELSPKIMIKFLGLRAKDFS